jgi:hypothetical protein
MREVDSLECRLDVFGRHVQPSVVPSVRLRCDHFCGVPYAGSVATGDVGGSAKSPLRVAVAGPDIAVGTGHLRWRCSVWIHGGPGSRRLVVLNHVDIFTRVIDVQGARQLVLPGRMLDRATSAVETFGCRRLVELIHELAVRLPRPGRWESNGGAGVVRIVQDNSHASGCDSSSTAVLRPGQQTKYPRQLRVVEPWPGFLHPQ